MKDFFKTVAIITIFSICEKLLGFIYRIYMSHTIGAEGVGLYQVSLSMFAFIFTLISSGVPITVSRLMTKYKAENKQKKVFEIITAGIVVSLFLSLPTCFIILLLHGHLSFLFADERCVKIFLILSPGLIFASVYSVMRGVFWGNKDFFPYSLIELLEEICMIIVGIILINNSVSVYDGAISAGIAVIVSYAFSFSLSIFVFIFRKNKLANPYSQFKPLLKSSTPVTIMRTVSTLAMSVVSIILPMRLVVAGFSQAQALSLYGSAVGQAVPLMFIPTSLISSLTLVLIPEISENFYKNNHKNLKSDIEKSIGFTIALTCLFVPVFFVCGKELGVLIFNNADCGEFLSLSSFLVVFIGLVNITTSILNSIGAENQVLFFYMISGVFMILSVWILPKYLGIYSLIIGYVFIYGLTSILNLALIKKKSQEKVNITKKLVVAILLTIPTIIIGLMLRKMVLGLLGSLFSIAVCSAVMTVFYLLLAVGFNVVDISMIKVYRKKQKNSMKLEKNI